jgi:tRNA-splicing ligase RtcB
MSTDEIKNAAEEKDDPGTHLHGNAKDIEMKQLNSYSYEMPKHDGMNVPGLVFASEKLMEKIKKDMTLKQVMNVAKLPGIIREMIAMPDCHQGYGFPIGGVAAFDLEKGIISPGGIGYDISCTTEDAKILTELGYTKEIKNFEENIQTIEQGNLLLQQSTACLKSLEGSTVKNKSAIFFMKKKADKKVIELKTELGFTLKATIDHPILLDSGMKPAGQLKKGDAVAVTFFEGVAYEEPEDKILLDDSLFKEVIARELEKRQLLPLSLNNPKLPYLIKIRRWASIFFIRQRLCLRLWTERRSE